MSAIATGWVFAYSPYAGDQFVVHLALADVADDMHDHLLRLTVSALAVKARCSERTVQYTLRDMQARETPLVELVAEGGGRGNPATYRFLMPNIERVHGVHRLERVQTPELLRAPESTQEIAAAPFSSSPCPRPSLASKTPPPALPVAQEGMRLTKAERDAIWDVVAEVCDGEWSGILVGASRGRMASGVADIIKLGCRTPDEVKARARVYRTKYKDCDLTPTALAANWPSLVTAVADRRAPGGADYDPRTAWMYQ